MTSIVDPKIQETLLGAQQALHKEASIHSQLQAEASKLALPKQQYAAQILENQAVLEELQLVSPENADTAVYKLVGPALLPIHLDEAKGNVEKRLVFMQGKVKDLDRELGEVLDKQRKSQEKFMHLQALIRKSRDQFMAQAQAQAALSAQAKQAMPNEANAKAKK